MLIDHMAWIYLKYNCFIKHINYTTHKSIDLVFGKVLTQIMSYIFKFNNGTRLIIFGSIDT